MATKERLADAGHEKQEWFISVRRRGVAPADAAEIGLSEIAMQDIYENLQDSCVDDDNDNALTWLFREAAVPKPKTTHSITVELEAEDDEDAESQISSALEARGITNFSIYS